MNIEKITEEVAYNLLKKASTKLPNDVIKAIKDAYKEESSPVGRAQLKAILENIDVADKENLGICQDTGTPLFFITWGLKSGFCFDIRKSLEKATERATIDVPLRHNVIHPLTLENPGTNVGWGMPYPYFEIDHEKDYIEITAVPKGFGAEVKSSLVFVVTSEDMEKAVLRCVVDNVSQSLGEACAPNIVGIGIGGTGDIALYLAKKALFRSPIGSHNEDPKVAQLEEKILKTVNETGIGPMGLGGDTTALAIHAEVCGTHTAVAPIGICFQCWASRYSKAKIYSNGKVEYITHKE